MVKEVVSFRLSEEELMIIDRLAVHYGVSRATVLRKIIEIFNNNLAMQETLEGEVKQEVIKQLQKKALKEIRSNGKDMLRKATWRVRMVKFYTKLMDDGLKWDEFEPTFDSWLQEAKLLGVDDKTVENALYEIASIYYVKKGGIDLEKGYKKMYAKYVNHIKEVIVNGTSRT